MFEIYAVNPKKSFICSSQNVYGKKTIIDFGTTEGTNAADNIIICIGEYKSLRIFISNNGVGKFDTHGLSAYNNLLVENTWFHFAVTVSNTLSKVTMYFDGANEVSSTLPG